MNSIKKFLSILVVLFVGTHAFAQGQGSEKPRMTEDQKAEMHEKMQTMKIAFITEKLSLTEKEAQEFWPVYNSFQTEIDKMKPGFKGDKKPDFQNMSDADIKKMVAQRFEMEQKELDIKKAYNEKFFSILSAQKVAMLYMAEHQFRKEMLDKLKGDFKGPQEAPSPKK